MAVARMRFNGEGQPEENPGVNLDPNDPAIAALGLDFGRQPEADAASQGSSGPMDRAQQPTVLSQPQQIEERGQGGPSPDAQAMPTPGPMPQPITDSLPAMDASGTGNAPATASAPAFATARAPLGAQPGAARNPAVFGLPGAGLTGRGEGQFGGGLQGVTSGNSPASLLRTLKGLMVGRL